MVNLNRRLDINLVETLKKIEVVSKNSFWKLEVVFEHVFLLKKVEVF